MKKDKKEKPSVEELIKKHEEFLKEKGLDEPTKEEFEENLRKLSSPKPKKK